MASDGKRVVVWLRNDLRLHDNYSLHKAAELVKAGTATEVVPLYCFDPRHFVVTPYGHPKTGAYRAQFMLESVQDLKTGLQKIGSDLIVHLGKPEDAIAGLIGQGSTVITQTETTSEENKIDAKVKRAIGNNGNLQLEWGSTLYHLDDLPFGGNNMQDLPDGFTPAKSKVESKCQVREPLPTPRKGSLPLPQNLDRAKWDQAPKSIEELQPICGEHYPKLSAPQYPKQTAHPFKGGEQEALRRLKHYTWDTGAVSSYFDTRNGMLGTDYSTKFSAWLAHGCLSPRTIHHEIKRYESEHGSNKSTYWVTFELTWRDYFKWFSIKHGDRMFYEGGIINKKTSWNSNPQIFQRWRDGQTGMPLVDANMREIAQTGFMSNRGRQNVASYLILDCGVDWRQGADYFESVLADYDVCSNWGNWISAAGLTGGRINKFNIVKQSKDYDEQGDYVRTWCPELAKVPSSHVHEPYKMSGDQQQSTGCVIDKDYPAPIPRSQMTPPFEHGDRGGRGGGRGRGGRRGGRRGGGRGGRNNRGGRGGGGGGKQHQDFTVGA
ncbi:hypothetical protein WJX74_001561 [Apatococcus lobatus]|uniref:Cryptochrome DASH n=1 Tax=Apatococcus lobatus TaxID=904363 RepID=A0AAW1RAN3_9CHLO